MEISLSGKRALVTGAAQGIGLGIVKKLVACGAQVVALDKQGDKLKAAVKGLPHVEQVVLDVSDWNSIEPALRNIGRVQLVVNNAGINVDASLQGMQEDAVSRFLDTNLKSIMAICKYVVNDWTSAEIKGSIVNMGSVASCRPLPAYPVYCTAKAAIRQYSRCLALDCAPKGIRVNIVSPGFVDTEMVRSAMNPVLKETINQAVPMPDKLLDTEDVANAVAFLLCDKVARRITGVNLNVDAGFMLT